MPVTWAHIARINAVRWGLLGTGFGLAATVVGWWRERARQDNPRAGHDNPVRPGGLDVPREIWELSDV
jgi:hypothetical protein